MRSFPLILFLAIGPAHAQADEAARLVQLINAVRAAPERCDGRQAPPVPPLAPQAALARVRLGFGRFLDQALEDAGYPVECADVIEVNGPEDAAGTFAALRASRCGALLDPGFASIGVRRSGTAWQIVLARPAPQDTFRQLRPDWEDVGKAVLAAVNTVRGQRQMCGDARYDAAAPLTWNPALGRAALAHSRYMSAQRHFSHRARNGSMAAERAQQAGYRWRRIGENIASGQESPQEAVAGWMASPGHCANIMNPAFTEMGAAYALDPQRKHAVIFWTQVFGTPK